MSSSELLTTSYDFTLPKELIATYPAHPRDSARLLVYNRATDETSHVNFYDLEHL
jgi:S-adenosylmethionine:tRNA ribosyltransferase-isomerase